MHGHPKHPPLAAPVNDESNRELSILRDVFGQLPNVVTLQDQDGRILLANQAVSRELAAQRRDIAAECIRSGRSTLVEESVEGEAGRQVLLTNHKPVRIEGHDLLLSSSADITEQKAFEDTLFHSAYYDELTELPTRRVIEHRVNKLLQAGNGTSFALAFLDIDNFKHINDYYGHTIGDMLLVEVARRLGMNLRASDMLSRISGDEFLLLLYPVESQDEVSEYVRFMLERIKAPFFIDNSELFASTSIGISLYPQHGKDYEALRHNADIAMYRVKNAGKGAAAFFDAGMEREAQERMKVEQSLRLAILEKRFCCAFQPKVDIRSREVKGIEALVRLRDDGGVIQAPGTFINLATELGLIDELTHLVLSEIVKSIDLINETFGPDTTISINVAAKQAGNPDFMGRLRKQSKAPVSPSAS